MKKSKGIKAGNGAVLYVRVSTKEQAQNLSLPTQEKACRDYCSREGLTFLRVFSEAQSAKTTNRDEFQAMLTYCHKEHQSISTLVVYNSSRFSRETLDYLLTRRVLGDVGIAIRSATEVFDDSPSGELNQTMVSAFATFDNKSKAQRTRAGMEAAMREGRWVHQPPLGYTMIRIGSQPSTMVPDPNAAPLILRAFELYSSGTLQKKEVLKQVTALGIKTKIDRPVSQQTFDRIRSNPLYMGRIKSDWGIDVKGSFEPIVPETLFLTVQATIKGKSATSDERTVQSPEFPLRVFVRCETCGTPLTGSFSTGRGRRKYPYTTSAESQNAAR